MFLCILLLSSFCLPFQCIFLFLHFCPIILHFCLNFLLFSCTYLHFMHLFIFLLSFHFPLVSSFLKFVTFSIVLSPSCPSSLPKLLSFSSSTVRYGVKHWVPLILAETSSQSRPSLVRRAISFSVSYFLESKRSSFLSIIFIKISQMQESKQAISHNFRITITRN